MFNSNADANGWLLVAFFSCIVAAFYITIAVRRDITDNGWRCWIALRSTAHRMALSLSVILFSVGVKTIFNLPLRIYTLPGIQTGESFYLKWINVMTDIFSVGVLLGVVMLTWTYSYRRFGDWLLPIIMVATGLIYSAGYFGTVIVIQLLTRI